jgi:type I restriction enzyme S subunit
MKPGYRQTEVGLIPDDWVVARLGDLGTVVRGGSPRPAGDPRYFNGDCVPWLTVGSLTNIPTSQLFITDTMTMLTEEGAKRSRTLQHGTLVIVNSGAKTLGVSKILSITCCANDGIAALINQRGGERRFICYFLNAQIKRLREVVAAGNDQLNLNTGRIALIAVPFPTEVEQQAIAEALTDVDALLGALDRLIAKKRDLKQAAMQQLLTGQTRLPGFHGEWKVKRLGEIGQFRNGINKAKEDFGHGYPFANLMDVFGVAKVSNSRSFGLVNSTSGERDLYELRKGDVLFVRSSVKPSGVGLTTLIQEDLPETVFSGFLLRFRDEGALTVEYKEHCFGEAGFREKLIASSTVSANTNINQVSLRALTIKFPIDAAEQTAIANVLSEMQAELAGLEQRRAKTRAIKQGMMQQLLTGRTRLVPPKVSHA